MPVTRRSFLKSGATSVLTTAIALGHFTPASGQGKPQPEAEPSPVSRTDEPVSYETQQSSIDTFTADTFRPYVGGIFLASAGSSSIEMTLVAVRELSPKRSTKITTVKPEQTECFALDFKSVGVLTDLTSIYDIRHAALGDFQLFLTRRQSTDGKWLYEAVFNRLR